MLHTDLLERKYGPVHVLVRSHDDKRRIVDIVDEDEFCRTHAVTWLSETSCVESTDFALAALEIKNGASLGRTFRDRGFGIEKRAIVFGTVAIPEWMREIFQVDGTESDYRVYEFVAVGGDQQRYSYGVVCEIDTPDFHGGEEMGVESGSQKEADGYLQALIEYLTTTDSVS